VITSTIGWRWIFFVNVPIGLIATLRARADLKELAKPETRPTIDWFGNILFAGGLSAVLLGITLGALGQVSELTGLLAVVLGLGVLVVFIFVENRERHPMLDLKLFRIREFAASGVAMFLNALARGAFTFVLVFYLQGPPRYLSPFTAGLFLIPTSAALATLGPISGWLSDRYGPRDFLVAGLVVSAAGFLWLANIGPDDSFWALAPALVLVGGGMGLFASPNRAAMMTAVRPERRGIASAIGATLLNTGSTISLGITLLVMSSVLSLPAIQAIFLGTANPSAPFTEGAGFLTAIHVIFLISAALCLVALVPSVLRGPSHLPGPEPSPEAGD